MINYQKLHFLHKIGRVQGGRGIVYNGRFWYIAVSFMIIKLLFGMQFIDTVLNGHVLLYLVCLHFICVTAMHN